MKESTNIESMEILERWKLAIEHTIKHNMIGYESKCTYLQELELEYDFLNDYIKQQEQHTATILSCIALLTQSGSNTKEIVMEKLKGLIE